jgi:hypothetical protein
MNKSNIVDKAISNKVDDLLKVEKYSIALSNFIERSDTPITIGLQGEWGTGKTSLMSLLLEDFNQKNIACSWVNTWEYSIFRGANETTPGVLRGMLEKLEESCKSRNLWSLKEESEKKFRKAARFLGSLANQIISNQTGVDIASAVSDSSTNSSASTAEIAEIKALITNLIEDLIADPKNPFERVVFFVDDLDRIPPSDAVEILEALKNIFDIPHCIFILAIDYDVVVKGLESKFGPKTEENEREFRSFFDKIIQVPFSMPTGTYDIENFLVEKLKSLGLEISEDVRENYVKTVKHTIGYNPRSLKRYLNSFSLINHLKEVETEKEEQGDDFILFALLGIQISFPRVFRLLTQKPDFTQWDKGFANKHGLEWDGIADKIQKFGENNLIDEEWEQVVWALCQKDPYLRSRVFSVLELLNLLRDKFKDDLEEQCQHAMAFAAITSVDDDAETKQAVQKVGNKTIFGGLSIKLDQLKEEQFPEIAIQNFNAFWDILDQAAQQDAKFRLSYAKTGCSFNDDSKGGRGNVQLVYSTNPSKKLLGFKLYIKNNSGITKQLYDTISTDFNLSAHPDLIYLDKENDLVVEAHAFQVLKTDYPKLLSSIAKKLTE